MTSCRIAPPFSGVTIPHHIELLCSLFSPPSCLPCTPGAAIHNSLLLLPSGHFRIQSSLHLASVFFSFVPCELSTYLWACKFCKVDMPRSAATFLGDAENVPSLPRPTTKCLCIRSPPKNHRHLTLNQFKQDMILIASFTLTPIQPRCPNRTRS